MITIPISKGKFAVIDDDDSASVLLHKWSVTSHGYVVRATSRKNVGGRKIVYLHRQLLGFPKCEVDHIDGDKLNNQRSNLRCCTHQQNGCNQKINAKNTSGAKGVYWERKLSKWGATIRVFRKQLHLGYFPTVKEAALAYDSAARLHFGEFARPNL